MNRTYALPAAIALTIHALLFVGSGKPPNHPLTPTIIVKRDPLPKPLEQEIEIIKAEIAAATNPDQKAGGGRPDEATIGIPEIPRPFPSNDAVRIEQEYKPVEIGKNGKLPTGDPHFGPPGDGRGPGGIIGANLLDNPPQTRFQSAPVYPYAMKVAGITGTVWVDFVVDENGRVHNVRVIKSTNAAFDEATVAAVSRWRFESGKRKGLPVRFRMSVPIVFNLSD